MEKRGQVNIYTCVKCKGRRATINLNSGTTPFMMRCYVADCGGHAESSFYRIGGFPHVTATVAWYRPIPDDLWRLGVDVQDHVLGGGLIDGPLFSARFLNDDEWEKRLCEADVDVWLQYVASNYKPPAEQWQRLLERFGRGRFNREPTGGS